MPKATLTELIKRRHTEDFVGRAELTSSFAANLALPVEKRQFVFGISGQAGVGKSYLLRRLRSVAEAAACVTAMTNEDDVDLPTTLARMSEQLTTANKSFDRVLDRYRDYRQRREEMEADPDLPPGAIAAAAKTVARAGLKLGRRAPVVGAALDLVDEDATVEQAAEWASFLARKLTNKDDVQLLREPDVVLTPLFVDGLSKLHDRVATVLLFDTYEKSSLWLDEWLRGLLEGRFGDLPSNMIICVAGQHELDSNLWANYSAVVRRMRLDVFTEDEAREYLTRHGVVDPLVVATVLQLSNRLPLLVATLAEPASRGDDLTDQSLTAVQRFLKWVVDPALRELALNAALPRRLDEDVLAELPPSQKGVPTIEWLRRLPFVQDGFRYHELVRAQMLRLKHRQAPSEWKTLQGRLASHYERRADQHRADGGTVRDFKWRSDDLERLYHGACERGDSASQFAAAALVTAFENSTEYSEQVLDTLRAAARDADAPILAKTCTHFAEILTAYKQERYTAAADGYMAFEALVRGTAVAIKAQLRLGALLRYANRPAAARDALSKVMTADADALAKNTLYRAYVERAECNLKLGDYEASLQDVEHALTLRPTSHPAILLKGRVLRALGRYSDALAAFETAYRDDQERHVLEKERAITFESAGQYAAAAEAVERSLAAYPACDHCWRIYSRVLSRHLQPPEIVERIESFDVPSANRASLLASRAVALGSLREYAAALRDCDAALALEPDLLPALVHRGQLRAAQGNAAAAREDFDRAVAIAPPQDDAAIQARARFLMTVGDYAGARIDFETLATRDPSKHTAYNGLARCYMREGNLIAAMAAARNALRIQADCDECWLLYGQAARSIHGSESVSELFAASVPDADAGSGRRIALAKANALMQLEAYTDAIREATTAILLGYEGADVYELRATAKAALRLFEEAAADYEVAVRLKGPDGKRLQNQRGLWLSYVGRYADAIAAYFEAKNDDMDIVTLYNIAIATARYRGITAAGPELNAAAIALESASQDDTNEGAGLYGRAGIAAVEGRTDDALNLLEAAIREIPYATKWAADDIAWLDVRSTSRFRQLVFAQNDPLAPSVR